LPKNEATSIAHDDFGNISNVLSRIHLLTSISQNKIPIKYVLYMIAVSPVATILHNDVTEATRT